MAVLLNIFTTWFSRSIGIAMPRGFAFSDSVRMQFSTLNRCDGESHLHCVSLKEFCRIFTKINCRFCSAVLWSEN
uniref:Putative secreted protein n=1 Tax=Anopheles darlingi TaxID=43151 RepID=A0A2M4DJY6_ANODA